MKDLILNLLNLVPDPRVKIAAAAVKAIIEAVKKDPSAATSESVDAAIAEALAVWESIKARGEHEISTTDIGSDVPNGGAN